jgi:hypothetical protein
MTDDMVSIRIIGVPVAIASRARRHYEAIQREFALIHFSGDETRAAVPERLLDVADRARDTLTAADVITGDQVLAAIDRGAATVDIELRISRSAALSMADLLDLLEEADDFCREGDLITLAVPEECRELRRWFFGEIVDQANGAAPTPWNGPNA